MEKPRIGFAGMTHLGLVSATGIAGRGFPVLCYDSDAERIAAIKAGRLPVQEPGLEELLRENGARQEFSADAARLGSCDVVYISTDVPTDDEGQSDLEGIRRLIDGVVAKLGRGAILVILCQVPPGFTRGLKFAPERLYYQVETLIFGRAVERATQPERYIVGCADPAKPLPPAFQTLLGAFGCPILPMRYESAELAKISINLCLVASISVANTAAELCESIGADWSEIVPALKLDKRIGQYSYLKPGLGIAGGNLERDLATVIRMAGAHRTDSGVISAWLHNSRHRRDWPGAVLEREVFSANPQAVLGVLGLAYKENTHSIKNSPSLACISNLRGKTVRVHDPLVPATAAPGTIGCKTALEAAAGVDALAILTPWPEYRELKPAELARAMRGKAVLDPYALLDGKAAAAAGLDYFTLGVPPLRGER